MIDETAATETVQKKTPKGAHIPQVPLRDALPIAAALDELGGPSSPPRIAQHMGTSPTSSLFQARLAAAGYFGLIRKEGDRRAVTERGMAAVQDGAEATLARRQAVMGTVFGPLMYKFRGRELSEDVLRVRLQDDLGVPETSAINVTRAMVESARDTGLLANDRFDTAAIEESRPPEADSEGETPRATTVLSRRPAAPPAEKSRQDQSVRPGNGSGGAARPQAPPFPPPAAVSSGIQIRVNLDVNHLSPDEIVELVRRLAMLDLTKSSAS
jgi:hypothetical protein